MEQLSFCLSSLLVASVVLHGQSLVGDEQSKLHFYRNKSAVSCPLPPKYHIPGAILKWRNGGNESTFHLGDKAEFVCKEGYRQIGWLKSFICQEDGSWNQSVPEQNGYCITNHCNGSKSFNCTDGSKSVDICHLCDCVADCGDGSDELSCDSILINVTGHATGILKYPNPSPEKSTAKYTGPLNCSRTLWTDDPGFYIKLSFKNVSLSSGCKSSYVSLENTVFTDLNKSPDCCQQIDNSSCRLGGNTSPPLARSVANWLTVTIAASASESSSVYRLQWFNVNGFFPNGLIPSDDLPYPTTVVVPKATTNPSSESPDIKHTLAVVLFAVLLFIAAWFAACMVGKRLIGPRCSFTYLHAMISASVHRRSRRASHATRDDPLARSPLTLDTDSPFVGERVSARNPDDRSMSSMSSNYGSTENVL